MNTIFKNLLKAIGIMAYFIVLNFAYTRMDTDRLINDIEVFSGIFLVLGLIVLERAYKKDSGNLALSGIEFLLLSMHSLSINHVITFYKYDFRSYLLTSSYIFAIYYVLKSIVSYTREKRQYLKELSDISEIVKEEPIKKEAKKRRKTKRTEEEKSKDVINKKEEVKNNKENEQKKTADKQNKDEQKGKLNKEKIEGKIEGKIENKKTNKKNKKTTDTKKGKKTKKAKKEEVIDND